ncbi:unnamed protein product [Closterium sp. Yama58-4]|nr:unnamed protein product [Closterium sp. Yama58-4]
MDASAKPAKPVKPLSHHTNGGTGRSGGKDGEKGRVPRFAEEVEDDEDTSCSSESARAAGSSVGSCESTCVRVPRGGMGFGAGIAESSEELDELRLEVAELRRRVARHEEEAKKLRDEVLFLRACGYEMHLAKSQQQQQGRVLTPATSASRLPFQDVGNLPAAVPGTIINTFGNPENAMSSLEMMMGMRVAGMAESAELRGAGGGGGAGVVGEGSAVNLVAAGAEAGKAERGGEQHAQGQKENRENRENRHPGNGFASAPQPSPAPLPMPLRGGSGRENGSNGLGGLNGLQERASPHGTGDVRERGVQDRGSAGVRDARGNTSGGDGLSVLPPLWASDSPSKENSHREGAGARGEADVAVVPAALASPRPAATSACPVLPARPATPAAAVARPPVYSGRASLEKMRPPPIKGMPLPWESVDDVANLQAGIGRQADGRGGGVSAAATAAAAAARKEVTAYTGGEGVGEQGKGAVQGEEDGQGVGRGVEAGTTVAGGVGLARSSSGGSAVKRRAGPALVWRELKLHPTNPFLSPPPATEALLWEEHGAPTPIAASALQVGPVEAASAAPETECYLAENRPKQQQQRVTAGVQVHPGEKAEARPARKSAMKGASPRTAANATLPAANSPATPLAATAPDMPASTPLPHPPPLRLPLLPPPLP